MPQHTDNWVGLFGEKIPGKSEYFAKLIHSRDKNGHAQKKLNAKKRLIARFDCVDLGKFAQNLREVE